MTVSTFDCYNNLDLENIDDYHVSYKDFHQAVVWGTDWTTGTIVEQLNKGNIDLNPRFQRREAWNKRKKSKFIESLILGLPIPQIILAERKDKKGTYLVIDGKQRLLSIRQFFSKPNDTEFPKLNLIGLDSLCMLNGLSYTDIVNDPFYHDYATAIENQSIRTIVIKNWPNEEFLYNVFLRLNTGSLQLSPQELRQALHPGPFIDFTDEFSLGNKQIQRILNIKKPDARMRDVELVIRYFAYKKFIESYSGNLKVFFDTTVKNLNDRWSDKQEDIKKNAHELDEAIKFTYSIWGKNAFRKWKDNKYQGRFNRAIFDIMTYYFSQPKIRSESKDFKSTIESKFKELCENDIEFLNSFETSTKNLQPTRKRFLTWGNALNEIINSNIAIPKIS